MNTKTALASPPRLVRTSIARGLRSFSAGSDQAKDKPIDPTGGDQGAGLIRGMAILTRGEANGHNLWCDSVMLAQACDAINAAPKGMKARFTHPGLSGDGLGKYTGRVKAAELDGDVLRGDLHCARMAHETPDGNLAGYVMGLADEDPESFGNSIAFDEDFAAELEFALQHGAEWKEDEYGQYVSFEKFETPDRDNVRNLPHARIKTLRAVDAVDDPAANPSGLFHRADELAGDAEKLIAFSLGLSTERPALVALDADPGRIAGFVQRFLARHHLTLSQGDKPVKLKTTAELDAELRQHFSGVKPPRKFEADKEDKKENQERGAQEEGDADKDEGKDKGKDEKRGDNYAAGQRTQLASDEGDGDDEEKDKKDLDDEEDKEKDKKDLTAAAGGKKLAVGGEAPGGDTAADAGSVEEEKQKTQKDVAGKSKKPAEKGSAVEPDDGADAVGPMGDASHNVGYSAAVKECQRFTAAFGPQGAVWFGQGKTFAQAGELHAKALAKERDDLKLENEELRKKLGAKRGLDTPLSGATSVPATAPAKQQNGSGLSKFTDGLAAMLSNRGNLN